MTNNKPKKHSSESVRELLTPVGKDWAEISFQIRMILEMRFGDGSGQPNPPMVLASKELESLIQSLLEKEREEVVEEIRNWIPENSDLRFEGKSLVELLNTLSHSQKGEND